MKIIRNFDPKWTMKHINHSIKYPREYNFEINKEEIEKEIERIEAGKPSPRGLIETTYFEIFDEKNM